MPTIRDKPLPSILSEEEPQRMIPHDTIISQVREATYSSSPLLRVLQDPTIIPPETSEYTKSPRPRSSSRSRQRGSRSPRREHRSDIVAAIAIAEEERQSRHLKTLLRNCGDRLDHEIRRADAATLRAELAERQEREAVSRAKSAEKEKDEMRSDTTRLERDMRNYQMQLEIAQREMRRLQGDLEESRREAEDLQRAEAQAQGALKRYQFSIKDLQIQVRQKDTEVQKVVDRWYSNGREQGYDEGYEEGYELGRKSGMKEGVKKGRKEGLQEGVAKGKTEERRNAMEAFDRFLSQEDMGDEARTERTRRWAQSIYNPDTSADTVYPLDSGSVV